MFSVLINICKTDDSSSDSPPLIFPQFYYTAIQNHCQHILCDFSKNSCFAAVLLRMRTRRRLWKVNIICLLCRLWRNSARSVYESAKWFSLMQNKHKMFVYQQHIFRENPWHNTWKYGIISLPREEGSFFVPFLPSLIYKRARPTREVHTDLIHR